MRLTLHTDQASYRPGQPVQLRLEVTNETGEPVRLLFRSSKKYDFEVLWEDQLIWRWSAERVFAQVETVEAFAPGQKQLFTATWDGRLQNGELAKPGEYVGRGYLTVSGRREPMADQTFTVAG